MRSLENFRCSRWWFDSRPVLPSDDGQANFFSIGLVRTVSRAEFGTKSKVRLEFEFNDFSIKILAWKFSILADYISLLKENF